MPNVLQSFCSRPHSLKAQLAQASWKKGIEIFFTQNIPFSGRNSPAFARQLASLFVKIARGAKTKPYPIYELGGGLGILARLVLDILQEEYPDIYQHTHMHLSDLSQETMLNLANSPAFHRHLGHVQFYTLDIQNLQSISESPPLLCYSVYLLDALDTRHITYRDGELFEVLVQTTAGQTQVLDTTQLPPQPLTEAEMTELLKQPDSAKTLLLLSQLSHQLEESYQETPLAPLPHWTEEEKKDLKGFIDFLNPTHPIRFNYIPQLRTHLDTIQKVLHPEGVYVVSDFGLASEVMTPDISELIASYGSTMFYSVCFPYLQYATQQTNNYTWNTSRDLDQTQEWVLFKKLSSLQSISQAFPSLEDPCIGPISEVLDTLSALTPDDPDYIDTFEKAVSTLTPDQQQDYFFLKKVCLQLFQDNYLTEAFLWSEKMVALYEGSAIAGLLVAGWIYQKQGDFDPAKACFNTVTLQCPTMAIGYASMAALYFSEKNYPASADFFKKALACSLPEETDYLLSSLEKAVEKMKAL